MQNSMEFAFSCHPTVSIFYACTAGAPQKLTLAGGGDSSQNSRGWQIRGKDSNDRSWLIPQTFYDYKK
jgi:hypothetical protein